MDVLVGIESAKANHPAVTLRGDDKAKGSVKMVAPQIFPVKAWEV
jgi:hypothetical protein